MIFHVYKVQCILHFILTMPIAFVYTMDFSQCVLVICSMLMVAIDAVSQNFFPSQNSTFFYSCSCCCCCLAYFVLGFVFDVYAFVENGSVCLVHIIIVQQQDLQKITRMNSTQKKRSYSFECQFSQLFQLHFTVSTFFCHFSYFGKVCVNAFFFCLIGECVVLLQESIFCIQFFSNVFEINSGQC